MKLTPMQEEALILKYDNLLWNVVHRFRRRQAGGYYNKEDLHQECALVLLRHIRSCGTMEEISRIPIRDMVNAMCVYVLGEQVLSYPKRTTNFKEVMSTAASRASYAAAEAIAENRGTWFADRELDDALDGIAFLDFAKSLPERERNIIIMKLQGYRNREIAAHIGMSDVMMTRTLKKIRDAYMREAA